MFWWRAGRLSAAAVELRSPGCCLVRVKANPPRHVTGTLRRGHTVQCRSVCGSVDSSAHAHLWTRQPETRPPLSWTLGVADSDRGHRERVAERLFRSVRGEGGSFDVLKPPPVHATRQPLGHVLFTGTWRVSSRTVHTRAASTAAAARRSDPAGETGADKRVNWTAPLDCLCNRSDPLTGEQGSCWAGLSVSRAVCEPGCLLSRWRQCWQQKHEICSEQRVGEQECVHWQPWWEQTEREARAVGSVTQTHKSTALFIYVTHTQTQPCSSILKRTLIGIMHCEPLTLTLILI